MWYRILKVMSRAKERVPIELSTTGGYILTGSIVTLRRGKGGTSDSPMITSFSNLIILLILLFHFSFSFSKSHFVVPLGLKLFRGDDCEVVFRSKRNDLTVVKNRERIAVRLIESDRKPYEITRRTATVCLIESTRNRTILRDKQLRSRRFP